MTDRQKLTTVLQGLHAQAVDIDQALTRVGYDFSPAFLVV